MASEVTVWNKVMSSALAIPGVQVAKPRVEAFRTQYSNRWLERHQGF